MVSGCTLLKDPAMSRKTVQTNCCSQIRLINISRVSIKKFEWSFASLRPRQKRWNAYVSVSTVVAISCRLFLIGGFDRKSEEIEPAATSIFLLYRRGITAFSWIFKFIVLLIRPHCLVLTSVISRTLLLFTITKVCSHPTSKLLQSMKWKSHSVKLESDMKWEVGFRSNNYWHI